jgi:hypothetical protein
VMDKVMVMAGLVLMLVLGLPAGLGLVLGF